MEKVDLLSVDRGAIIAPAGCGKTHLIAEALRGHTDLKPILVLTHTNAGVAALRVRLDHAGVPSKSYKLSTIDGWAMRVISTFPQRAGNDSEILELKNPKDDYPHIRKAARNLFEQGHIKDVLKASYSRIIVDEYQDCSYLQHCIVVWAADTLKTCILGDPMQAIFGFGSDRLAHWNDEVCTYFPIVGQLQIPWRWINTDKKSFGDWLLDVRKKLENKEAINLTYAPQEVIWVQLKECAKANMMAQISAANTKPSVQDGRVLIIGDSKNPKSQRAFASKILGAVTVESVDLRDFVEFAKKFSFTQNSIDELIDFAGSVMVKTGALELKKRVNSLQNGTARKEASDKEKAALEFCSSPSPQSANNLLVEINKEGGVRSHRPAILSACQKALRECDGTEGNTFYDMAVRMREQNRLIGRPLAKRSVGSTLLLKGLEADVCVILNADELDAKNLYVAMTRGARQLIICSTKSTLNPWL